MQVDVWLSRAPSNSGEVPVAVMFCHTQRHDWSLSRDLLDATCDGSLVRREVVKEQTSQPRTDIPVRGESTHRGVNHFRGRAVPVVRSGTDHG
jgi:hypothetical protein